MFFGFATFFLFRRLKCGGGKGSSASSVVCAWGCLCSSSILVKTLFATITGMLIVGVSQLCMCLEIVHMSEIFTLGAVALVQ